MTDYIIGIDVPRGADKGVAVIFESEGGPNGPMRIVGTGRVTRNQIGGYNVMYEQPLTIREGDTVEVRHEPAPVTIYSLYSDGQGFEFFDTKTARDTALAGPRWSRVLRACVHLAEHEITADNIVEVLAELTGQAHG